MFQWMIETICIEVRKNRPDYSDLLMITTNAIAAAVLEKNETKNNDDDVKKKKVFEKPPPPRVRLIYLWFDTEGSILNYN